MPASWFIDNIATDDVGSFVPSLALQSLPSLGVTSWTAVMPPTPTGTPTVPYCLVLVNAANMQAVVDAGKQAGTWDQFPPKATDDVPFTASDRAAVNNLFAKHNCALRVTVGETFGQVIDRFAQDVQPGVLNPRGVLRGA